MKRILLLLTMALVCLGATRVDAGAPATTSRYGEWVRVNNHGVVTYRYVYRGFRNGFPPPAMYYYGYPQSGWTYGTGISP